MKTKHFITVGLVIAFVMTLGTGYWVYASPSHGMNQEGHMMKESHSDSAMMKDGHKGKMGMPMMHGDMSKEDMGKLCDRMKKRHVRMQSMRQKNTEKLNSLVNAMKKAKGTEKIESMEKVLVELVEQHNKRSAMMMGQMRSMMGSMMVMHQMSPDKRKMMMDQMRNCPMMQGMMTSGHESEDKTESSESDHHE